MDIKTVNSVTTAYIFMQNDIREKVSTEKLESMFTDINSEVIYYHKLWQDLLDRIEVKRQELNKMHCPSQEEIQQRDILKSIELQMQREKYITFSNNISGLSDMFQDVSEKMYHYERLQRQVKDIYKTLMQRQSKIA
jgi:hypothetical protein